MGFTHGTYVREQETKLKSILAAKTPVVIVGTAPINMGDLSCVNKPQLIMNPKEATQYFGGINNIKGFTISEALYVAFNLIGTSPIICINILDPTKHKVEKSFNEVVVIEKEFTLEDVGILNNEKLILKNSDTSAVIPKDNYECKFNDDGKMIVTLTEDNILKVEGSYEYLDPSLISEADVVGSVDPSTLEAKGLECLKDIFPTYSMIPGVVIAPDIASETIRAVLDTKSQVIGDKWLSFSIPEIPNTTKYGDVIKLKKDQNMIDEDQIIMWGVPYLGEQTFHQSIIAAIHMQYVDSQNGGVPYESPSNKNVKVSGIGYYDNQEFKKIRLDESTANLLNENGISTIISRSNGTVFWGNRTSIFQPGGNSDPKDIFIPIKRMAKYLGNTIMLNQEDQVDKPMEVSRAKALQANINNWLASLTSEGKLLGARVEFTKNDNPVNDLIAAKFKWHIYFGGVLPGETLEFIIEYDGEYLNTLFA